MDSDEPVSRWVRATRGRAMTLAEVVVATAVVAVMLVAALNTLGASARGYVVAGRAQQGGVLAEQLMAEIVQNCYKDPDGSPLFGIEAGDTGTGRTGYDDVDDYHGCRSPRLWHETAPLFPARTAGPGR